MINDKLYNKIESSISKFDDISGKSGLSVEYIIINILIEHNKLDKVNYADMLEAIMLTDGSDIEEFLEEMYKKIDL